MFGYPSFSIVWISLIISVMKNRVGTKQRAQTSAKKAIAPPSREFIQSLRGKFRGKGLLKALIAEKKREREL